MNTSLPTSNTERVYALDALRAVMMLLGLVIHAAVTYGSFDYQAAWPLKNPVNSPWFDLLASLIHTFRMPVFFTTAGYFSALLFARKGPKGMLLSRARRIVLPFLVAVLVCYPLVVFSFSFSTAAFAGVSAPFAVALETIVTGKFLPYNVVHLWFLYYLILYTVIGWLLALVLRRDTNGTRQLWSGCQYILQQPVLRIVILSLLLFGCLQWMGVALIKGSNDWRIPADVAVTYFVFFGSGWLIYTTNTLAALMSYPRLQLVLATLLFMSSVFIPWPTASWVLSAQMGLTALATALFVFGFIAFFQQYFNHYSPRLNYLMNAAYWIYIIHLPIIALIPGLLATNSLPVVGKFSLTLCLTTVVCLVSYHYLVRQTVIGTFLSGRSNNRKLVDQWQ